MAHGNDTTSSGHSSSHDSEKHALREPIVYTMGADSASRPQQSPAQQQGPTDTPPPYNDGGESAGGHSSGHSGERAVPNQHQTPVHSAPPTLAAPVAPAEPPLSPRPDTLHKQPLARKELEPVHIWLTNPRRVSSGFTMAIPARLRTLVAAATEHSTSEQFDSEEWTKFIREMNAVLAKAPGILVSEVCSSWLANAVTLGLATFTKNMIHSRVESKAVEVMENWNRSVFAQWRVAVRFEVVSIEPGVLGSSPQGESMSQFRHRVKNDATREARGRRGFEYSSTLELVVDPL
ncbi:hypothetical protein GQ54DRAFT_30453 [Martensiomyces pterosporus]|nr:hypothetical protein GQ54DRAFT_30453 [Martensiomyces pterosporus]